MPSASAPARPIAFSVVSIRQVPSADADPMTIRFLDDGASFERVPIAWIVQQAFSPAAVLFSDDDRILGLPGWTKSNRYDIQAKVDGADIAQWKSMPPAARRSSFRPMLESRLNLRFHHELRDRPVYSLVLAKGGSKLHAAGGSASGSVLQSTAASGNIHLQRATMPVFANLLSSQGLHSLVLDKTGLTGSYDISLHWSPDSSASADDTGPSLFTALQEQLGLRLVLNKDPSDVVVIDRIDRPSAN